MISKWLARIVLAILAAGVFYAAFFLPAHYDNSLWPLGHEESVGLMLLVILGYFALIAGLVGLLVLIIRAARL